MLGQKSNLNINFKFKPINWLTEEIPYSDNFCIEARLESKNRTECCIAKVKNVREERKSEKERELRGKTSWIKTDFLLNNTTEPCSLFIDL